VSIRAVVVAVVMPFLICANVATAAAQTTPTSVSVGYQVPHIPDETYPLGFNFDVAAPLRTTISLVGDLGYARDVQNEPGVSGTLQIWNYGVGPRWMFGTTTMAMPYVQLIVGGVHTNARLVLDGAPFGAAGNAFMLQPGVGVVVPVAGIAGVFGQFDYRRAFFPENGENEVRALAGVRIGLR
jgi:hypothetical protein